MTTPTLRTLVVDDGSGLAAAIVSRLDPAVLEINRIAIAKSMPAELASRCREVDAVVFISDSWEASATMTAIEAVQRVLDTLGGSGKKFVYVSESLVIGDTDGSFGNEDSPRSTRSPHPWQSTAEAAVGRAISTGVHAVIVRPSLVHGRGAGALLHALIEHARTAAEATFVGDGDATTSTLHVDDLARLIQAALLRAPQGAVYTAASEEVLTWKDIAELVAHMHSPPSTLRSLSMSEADDLGLDGKAMAINNVIVDNGPRRRLGWLATGPTLADELTPVESS